MPRSLMAISKSNQKPPTTGKLANLDASSKHASSKLGGGKLKGGGVKGSTKDHIQNGTF